MYYYCQSQEILFKKIFLLEKFTSPNSLILVKDLTRGKRGFDIFFIDHYVGDIGNKNITGEY